MAEEAKLKETEEEKMKRLAREEKERAEKEWKKKEAEVQEKRNAEAKKAAKLISRAQTRLKTLLHCPSATLAPPTLQIQFISQVLLPLTSTRNVSSNKDFRLEFWVSSQGSQRPSAIHRVQLTTLKMLLLLRAPL